MFEPDLNAPEFRFPSGRCTRLQRFAMERERLLKTWDTVAIGERLGVITTITGVCEPIPGVIRDFRIAVPESYPYDGPEAFSVGWLLQGPHQFPNQRMCLWRENDWTPARTLAYAVAKTFVWIHKHEVYLSTRKWPGREQQH